MKFIILLLAAVSIWANIGNIAVVQGSAEIHRAGATLPATSGTPIEQKDQIVTQEKTKVQVILKDNTVVTIGANSSFNFLEFSMQKGDEKVSMQAQRGFFRSVTGQIGKVAPERFKVHTVSATIGIRGTDFSALIQKKREIIKCYKGMIRVNFHGGFKDIVAGRLIEITPNGGKTKNIPTMKHNRKFKKMIPQDIEPKNEDAGDINTIIEHGEEPGASTPPHTPPTQPFTITPGTNDRPVQY